MTWLTSEMCCLRCEQEKLKMADHNILCSIEYIRNKQSCPLYRIESQTDEPLQFLEKLGYALVILHVLERRRLSNLSKELKDMMDKFFYARLVLTYLKIYQHKKLVKIRNQRNLGVICAHEVKMLPEFAPNV
ncbi:hypothetical protein ACJJTC_007285 [Scirpophaga incertulas]